jgi:acetyltransferase-like isoleucine patch superfamily enzyme
MNEMEDVGNGRQISKFAVVETGVLIEESVQIWHWTHIRERASIGEGTRIGKGVYIDHDVHIGRRCKIQNNVSVYFGVRIEDEVFVGPHVCFTNDRNPRAVGEWSIVPTIVKRGASIGANSTIVCGVTIGEGALIGAGSVVTKDVPPREVWVGNPARRLR